MWEDTDFEKIAKKYIRKAWPGSAGERKVSEYVVTRGHLVEEILPEIRAVQPNLTDHGPEHIRTVLSKAGELIGEKENLKALGGVNLYCLLQSILFHDVGNIFDRDEHQRKVRQIYDLVRPEPQNPNEKNIVLNAVAAHCGRTASGSRDTLSELDPVAHTDGKRVDLRNIAAILRFADELSEGRNRTSHFMGMLHGYPPDNEIFHKYAAITSIFVDRNNSRIAVTYNMTIEDPLDTAGETKLVELLEFTYKAIEKLDQERQYAKYYCDILSTFKKTEVVFNFRLKDHDSNLGLPKLVLTDIVVPGERSQPIPDRNGAYAIPSILSELRYHTRA